MVLILMTENFYTAFTPSARVLDALAYYFQEERMGDTTARRRAQNYLRDFMVETGDGSYTLPSQDPSENMHSTHGAATEARMKYAIPSGLGSKSQVRVLDLCTGLGYNAAALLEQQRGRVELDLVEYSQEALAAALLVPEPMPSHRLVKQAIEDHLFRIGYLGYQVLPPLPSEVVIHVHTGDARQVVGELKPSYQAVYLDPFSPSKSPELYTAQFLKMIAGLLSPTGRILTYSSAAPVRMALVRAGLEVGEGPQVGRRGGTIASPTLHKLPPLTRDDERMVALSDAGVPYQDPDLRDAPPAILERQRKERKKARNNTRLASTVRTPVYLNQDVSDPRLKRRLERQIRGMGLEGLNSPEACYLVCPQYEECICFCGQGRYPGSRARIMEMQRRLGNLKRRE
jgi:tRNA U34 5-methylaminomethyl-2-thiouridine-forming methyltransferase MnmC